MAPSARTSAGLLLYRGSGPDIEVFLAHPGGPFWARKDAGAWTLPKGEVEEGEDPLQTALREFEEETGGHAAGPFLELGEIRQKAGKRVIAWAARGDADPTAISSNTVRIEWPAGSGRFHDFPEIDRCAWFPLDQARLRINPAQVALLDRLAALLG